MLGHSLPVSLAATPSTSLFSGDPDALIGRLFQCRDRLSPPQQLDAASSDARTCVRVIAANGDPCHTRPSFPSYLSIPPFTTNSSPPSSGTSRWASKGLGWRRRRQWCGSCALLRRSTSRCHVTGKGWPCCPGWQASTCRSSRVGDDAHTCAGRVANRGRVGCGEPQDYSMRPETPGPSRACPTGRHPHSGGLGGGSGLTVDHDTGGGATPTQEYRGTVEIGYHVGVFVPDDLNTFGVLEAQQSVNSCR